MEVQESRFNVIIIGGDMEISVVRNKPDRVKDTASFRCKLLKDFADPHTSMS